MRIHLQPRQIGLLFLLLLLSSTSFAWQNTPSAQVWAGVEGMGPYEPSIGEHSNLAMIGMGASSGIWQINFSMGQSFEELLMDDSVQGYLEAEFFGNLLAGVQIPMNKFISAELLAGINYLQLEGNFCQSEIVEDELCKQHDTHSLGATAQAGIILNLTDRVGFRLAYAQHYNHHDIRSESFIVHFILRSSAF